MRIVRTGLVDVMPIPTHKAAARSAHDQHPRATGSVRPLNRTNVVQRASPDRFRVEGRCGAERDAAALADLAITALRPLRRRRDDPLGPALLARQLSGPASPRRGPIASESERHRADPTSSSPHLGRALAPTRGYESIRSPTRNASSAPAQPSFGGGRRIGVGLRPVDSEHNAPRSSSARRRPAARTSSR